MTGETVDINGRIVAQLRYLSSESLEFAPAEFVEFVADTYALGRELRSAGDGLGWAACFQEGRQLIHAHRDSLGEADLAELRGRLHGAGYYQQKEMRDPFELGPITEE